MESPLARVLQALHRISVAMAWLFVVVAVFAIVAGGIDAWRRALLFVLLAPLVYGIGLLARRLLAGR